MTAKHHYVPRFYLEGFVDPLSSSLPNPYLWIVDLEQGTLKKRSPETAARITGYYDLRSPELPDKVTLETLLSRVESRTSKIIRRLRKNDFEMKDQDRHYFAYYIGVQHGRVPGLHKNVNSFLMGRAKKWLSEYIVDEDALRSRFGDDAAFFKEYVLSGKARVTPKKEFVIALALRMGFTLAELIARMRWTYFLAAEGSSFFTSDNPVALLSPNGKSIKIDFRGRNSDLEISFPISPSCTLLIHDHDRPQNIISVNASIVSKINASLLPSIHRYAFCSTEQQGQWLLDQPRNAKPS